MRMPPFNLVFAHLIEEQHGPFNEIEFVCDGQLHISQSVLYAVRAFDAGMAAVFSTPTQDAPFVTIFGDPEAMAGMRLKRWIDGTLKLLPGEGCYITEVAIKIVQISQTVH